MHPEHISRGAWAGSEKMKPFCDTIPHFCFQPTTPPLTKVEEYVRFCPPVNGLKDPWPMSCRCPEPRWFVGDPTSLARDNILSRAGLIVV